jgi:hypothetical protein
MYSREGARAVHLIAVYCIYMPVISLHCWRVGTVYAEQRVYCVVRDGSLEVSSGSRGGSTAVCREAAWPKRKDRA